MLATSATLASAANRLFWIFMMVCLSLDAGRATGASVPDRPGCCGAEGGAPARRARPEVRPETQDRKLVEITESTSSPPMTMLVMLVETFSRRRALDEDADEQHAGDDAVQRAAAAEDRDAAEQHRRDDLELVELRVVAAGAAVAQRVVDPGERGDRAGHDEQQELRPLDVDPGEAGGLVVEPDLVDPAPEGREVQQQREQRRPARTKGTRTTGIAAALDDPLLRQVGPALREVGDRPRCRAGRRRARGRAPGCRS